uniref:Uncharacterized protein n=1 Tax=Hemiselmis andersenii TaxID=464988 RepID=A0A6U5BWK4_HEMAN|mmetsp:Transcript_3958/g.9017  ORF Transcript_3958/g.9017 Transcript_3958/m.9017 type:complete len:211 (-) Transcript_3958:319-951(-)|eukprot:CAMPEP_0169454518 /NCGR_PEP_ID=MMETSP1042-20121227/15320_1 /TAXON_ID=464988 /ORGANISM="Hemiselmis andersenii, Strain CCMP1180" /LENGTH=210 /DNA_ID=CAMNT_0009566595 /DNA_START=49 /DNA_END=681 /DNA_ORIENTATION=+
MAFRLLVALLSISACHSFHLPPAALLSDAPCSHNHQGFDFTPHPTLLSFPLDRGGPNLAAFPARVCLFGRRNRRVAACTASGWDGVEDPWDEVLDCDADEKPPTLFGGPSTRGEEKPPVVPSGRDGSDAGGEAVAEAFSDFFKKVGKDPSSYWKDHYNNLVQECVSLGIPFTAIQQYHPSNGAHNVTADQWREAIHSLQGVIDSRLSSNL